MRRLTIFVFVCCCAAPAQAALLLYDGFDYTASQSLDGQTNVAYGETWQSNNAGVKPHIESGNLSVAGMPDPVGNMVGFDSDESGITRISIPHSPFTSGTTYWSGFLRVTDVDTLTDIGSQLVGGFNNQQGPSTGLGTTGAILAMRRDSSDTNNEHYFLGTSINAGGANRVFSSISLQEGDTVFVVASYTFVDGPNNDEARLWINPSPHAAQPTESVLAGFIGGVEQLAAGGIQSFHLRNVPAWDPVFQMDELRIGRSWHSVTSPEPATLGLLLLGYLLMYARRRSR